MVPARETVRAQARRAGPAQEADAAIARGRDAVLGALRAGNQAVANELLKRATTTDIVRRVRVRRKLRRRGCHGPVYHRTIIGAAGVTFGWRQVRVAGWCWRGRRIRRWHGADYRKYSAAPYCWTNESTDDGWWKYPRVRLAYTRGTLGGNAVFGCVGFQTIVPGIYYRYGGRHTFRP